MPSRDPSILSSAEGEKFAAGPFAITSRVSGAQSEGAFEMYELAMGPATIDYHIHRRMDETIHVLEGAVEFIVAGKKFPRWQARRPSFPEASTTGSPTTGQPARGS